MIKAIETPYNGCLFRSRLEARVAVFFDTAHIRRQYEVEGYEDEDGTRYLPDFYLPDLDVHVEVKANTPESIPGLKRAVSMIKWGGPIKQLLIISDIPGPCDGGMWHFPCFYWRGDKVACGWFFFCAEDEKVTGRISYAKYRLPNVCFEDPGQFSIAAVSDAELRRTSWPYSKLDQCNDIQDQLGVNGLVFEALEKARTARFEWGETPDSTSDIKKSTKRRHIATTEKEYTPRERGSVVAQKLILTWMANYPSLTGLIMEYIKPEDFTVEIYREVATMVYDQARAGEVNVSRLLNHFMDSEQHTLVSSLFNEPIVLDGEGQMVDAFAEAVIRIKRCSMYQKKEGGQENIMAFYQMMRDLQNLQSKRGELTQRFLECLREGR